MPLKGDLRSIGLAEIFQMISMSRNEGTLVVRNQENHKAIYFGSDGVRLLSSGQRRGLRIGDILVRSGRVSPQDLESVLERHKQSGRLLGEELVASGLVTEDEIRQIVRLQIEAEIYDLFLWTEATFEFIEGPPPEQLTDPEAHVVQLSLDPNALLLEAVRRSDEWARIRERIPSFDCVFAFVSPEARRQELSVVAGRARTVLERLDGESSVADLVEDTLAPRFEVCQSLLNLLLRDRIRMLQPNEVADAARRAMSEGRRDRALRLFQASVRLAPGDPETASAAAQVFENESLTREAARLYFVAGKAFQAQGRTRECISAFERAVALQPEDAEGKMALFEIKLEQGNIDDALQFAEQTIQERLSAGDIKTARALAEKGVAAAPNRLETRVALAHVYNALGMKSERDETVLYIHKNLPIDPVAANQVLRSLRELADVGATAPPAERRRRPSRFLRRRGGIIVAASVGALLVVAALYELQARRVYSGVSEEVAKLEERGKLDDAKSRMTDFLSGPYRFSFLTMSRARRDMIALEGRLRDASDEQAIRDRKKEEEERRRKEEQRRKLAERLQGMEGAMEDAFRRGELSVALNWARQLQDLARQLGDSRRAEAGLRREREVLAYEQAAAELRLDADQFEGKGDYRNAALRIDELFRRYAYSSSAAQATYPVGLRVKPRGVQVLRGESVVAVSGDGDIVVRLKQSEKSVILKFQRAGFVSKKEEVGPLKGLLEVRLDERAPDWTYPLGADLMSPPVGEGDFLFLRLRDRLLALDSGRRILRWDLRLDGPSPIPPKLARGTLLVPVGSTLVVADGRAPSAARVLDRITLPAPPAAPLGISADGAQVYVVTAEPGLYVIRVATRVIEWRRELPREAVAEPVERDGLILVACRDGWLYAVKGPGEQGIVWRVDTGGELAAGPHVGGPMVYLANRSGRVLAVNASGSTTWSSPEPVGEAAASPIVAGKRVIVPTVEGVVGLDAGSGAVAWRNPSIGEVRSPPVAVSGGLVLAAGPDRWLYALESEGGEVAWRCAAGRRIRQGPVVVGNRAFFAAEDLLLYAVATE